MLALDGCVHAPPISLASDGAAKDFDTLVDEVAWLKSRGDL